MTREEIRARILTHLVENASGPTFWTPDEIDASIQDAQEIMAEEVQGWRRTVYLPKIAGTQFYTLRAVAPDCMAPSRVWDQNTHQRLKATTMRQIDGDRERWLTSTSSQSGWWFPVSYGRFGVYPATAEGGGLLRVDYLGWPTPMEEDDDEPEGSESDQDALVLYSEYEGLIQQWEVARATERFVQFTRGWKDARARNDVERLHAQTRQRSRMR